MTIQAKCKKERVKYSKNTLAVINNEIEQNAWCVEGKMLLPGKTLSAMERNITKLPGVFSFNSAIAGHKMKPKYFMRNESGSFDEVSEAQEADIHKLTDDFVIKIEAANGQLGPLDFEYFAYLEKMLFDKILDSSSNFISDKNEKYYMGTYYDFLNNVVGSKGIGGSSYAYLENFFHRITGLNISYHGRAKYTVKYKMNDIVKERPVSGNYHPFRNFVADGVQGGNKGIWLEVDADYISNIFYGYTKLVYNELVRDIDKASSKFLFRFLTLHDKKPVIPIKYSDLTQMMGITRHTKKSDIMIQIGKIARYINNDKHGNLLVYASINDDGMFGKNYPFIMKPMKDKKDWQLLFCLNTFVTPDMQDYGVQTITRSIIENKQNRMNEIFQSIDELARIHDMSIKEYLDWGLTAVSLARSFNLTDREMDAMKKRSRLKATNERIVGRQALNAYDGNFDEAVNGLQKTKAARAEGRRMATDQASPVPTEGQEPRRGRGRPKGSLKGMPF